jgi:hypothetical protein
MKILWVAAALIALSSPVILCGRSRANSTGHVGENWVRHRWGSSGYPRERNKHLSRSQERPRLCQAVTCYREAGCEVALHYYRTIATAAVSADGGAQATTPYQMIPSADCEAGR